MAYALAQHIAAALRRARQAMTGPPGRDPGQLGRRRAPTPAAVMTASLGGHPLPTARRHR